MVRKETQKAKRSSGSCNTGFPYPVVFGNKGYPLEIDKKLCSWLFKPEESIVIIEKEDRIDVYIPKFGKVHIPYSKDIKLLVDNLRKVKKESENFSKHMLHVLQEYGKIGYSCRMGWYTIFWSDIRKTRDGKYVVTTRSEVRNIKREYDEERDLIITKSRNVTYRFLAEVANSMVRQGYDTEIIENRLLKGIDIGIYNGDYENFMDKGFLNIYRI